jgi:hypothetical protein
VSSKKAIVSDPVPEIVSFGFEDFWPQASKEYTDVFHVIARLISLVICGPEKD